MPTGQLSLAYRIKAGFPRTTLIRSPTKKTKHTNVILGRKEMQTTD